MKKYLYWIILGAVVIAGVGVSIYLGDHVESLPKVTYSLYESPQAYSDSLLLHLQNELRNADFVLLGVAPGRRLDLQVWQAFLAQSQYPDLKYQAVVIDPELPYAKEFFPEAVPLDLKKEMGRFVAGVKNAQGQGVRMAVIAPSLYTSQILKDNPAEILKKEHGLKPMSLTLAGFARRSEEESKAPIPCVIGNLNRDGGGALGCEIQNLVRPLYRQFPAKPEKSEGLVYQSGERDYLLLLN